MENLCVVNDDKPLKETKLSGAKPNTSGWVPYFNMFYSDVVGATMRAMFIDPDSYGVPIHNLFS